MPPAGRLLLPALILAALALPGTAAGAVSEEPDGGTPLERARERFGTPAAPPRRYELPGAALSVSPTELVAGRPGQRIRFTVSLLERVPDAELVVTLPERWTATPASGVPYARPPRVAAGARGARLARAGRRVSLTLDRGAAGDVASFEVEDVGIPAGTYELPISWRAGDGRLRPAGTARVVLYAPSREGAGEVEGGPVNPWARLLAPGSEVNATNDAFTESESFVAATEGDPARLALGVNGGTSMSAWLSQDGGETWARQVLPQSLDAPGEAAAEAGDICCDPMMAADSLGNLWLGGLTFPNGAGSPSRIVVNRIAAGETTFRGRTVGLAQRDGGDPEAFQDKPMMTIDNSPSSPTFGRLYVVWDEPVAGGINVVVSQCDTRPGGIANAAACDEADNWSAPATVAANGSYIYADVAVGPAGQVYVTWWDYSSTNAIRGRVCTPASAASTACRTAAGTAGSGWGAVQTVALLDKSFNTPLPWACPMFAQPGGRAGAAPGVAVDRASGRVYVSWGDLRAGSGSAKCADGRAPTANQLTWDSFVASAVGALPGGASPSALVGRRLYADGAGGAAGANSDDWFPWVTVDQTTGQAWAAFYSTRDDASRETVHTYARTVTPAGDGLRLGARQRVSAAPSDYSDQPCCDFGNDYGDYLGIDATGGRAYPAWSDRRLVSGSPGDGEGFAAAVVPAGNQAPTSSLGGPDTAVAGQAVTFSATGADDPEEGPLTYSWDLDGDGTFEADTGSTASVGHSFAAAGTYVVRVRATDEQGTSGEASRTVSVTEPSGGTTGGGTTGTGSTTGEPTTTGSGGTTTTTTGTGSTTTDGGTTGGGTSDGSGTTTSTDTTTGSGPTDGSSTTDGGTSTDGASTTDGGSSTGSGTTGTAETSTGGPTTTTGATTTGSSSTGQTAAPGDSSLAPPDPGPNTSLHGPRVAVTAAGRQPLARQRAVLLALRSDADARVAVTATLSAGRAARAVRLPGTSRAVRAGQVARVKLSLGRRGLAAVRRALARRARAAVSVRLTVTDAAGRSTTVRRSVRAKR